MMGCELREEISLEEKETEGRVPCCLVIIIVSSIEILKLDI